MQIKVNLKMIKDRCGAVSFKRGEAFYRSGKVRLDKVTSEIASATVEGTENFHVTIEKDTQGSLHTKCSCPSLSSFKKDCQHVAAVLLALHERQKNGTPILSSDSQVPFQQTSSELSDRLLTLFGEPTIQNSAHQLHFENRQVIDTTFQCKAVTIAKGKAMFGIEMELATNPITNIREFLQNVKEGKPYRISSSLTYDAHKHCFQKETDAVVQELMIVMDDEKMYHRAIPSKFDSNNQKMILVPASSWERLEPLLTKVPSITLDYDGKRYHGFHLSDEELPLTFEFEEAKAGGYQLRINGLNRMFLMREYHTVLFDGKVIPLKRDDSERLSELVRMLDHSGTNQIPIPEEQIKYFMEKLVPALRKMGEIHLSGAIIKRLRKTPLSAKLYLDRLKDRLLAGLEFHYENVIINPLEKREPQVGSMIIRDKEKEEEILQIMKDSQFNRTESGYYFHNEELEYNFLFHELPKLQKLVQVYATTAVRTRIIPKTKWPKIKVKHKKERTNWLEFTFDIDGIPQKEIKGILAALEEKRKYHRLRDGALLSLETREFAEIGRFLHAAPVQDDDEWERGLEVPVVTGLRLLDSVEDSNAFSLDTSFRMFLENIYNPDALKFAVPKSLDAYLREYQKHGYKWMKSLASYGFGGILADDMGLGKTLQSITYIVSELERIRESSKPVLIVCPSSLTYNWEAEMMKYAPEIQAVVIDGNKAERVKLLDEFEGLDVLITSYPLLRSDIALYEKLAFHTVFFDEAQTFKNPLTQTARAVKKIMANHRFALTGTPMENALEELWSIFHVVFPELFLSLREYSNLTKKQIARRIRPFMLRRLKEDVLHELPEKNESIEVSELLAEQKKLYASYLAKLRHDTFKYLEKDTIRKNRIKILAGLTRLRQICCHPALFVDGYEGSSAKFEQLIKIMEESKLSGRRVLIFSQFTKMLQLIGAEFAYEGRPYFYLDGQTPSEERLELCNRFNNGERDIFLISLKAGGTGLNLTGADTVIFYDSWWNPAVEEQAADRAHRIGQTHTVEVIKLVAKGTIEEKMNDLQDKKRHLIEEIIDPVEKTQTRLTEEDIRDLLG